MPGMPFARPIALTLALTGASPAFAIECFSMFDAKNALVYQSSATPIDLSRSISSQMAQRFPRRTLVISDLGACPETGVAATGATSASAGGPGAFGADATSLAPMRAQGDLAPTRTFKRAPGGRR